MRSLWLCSALRGSSPRVRGTVCTREDGDPEPRIIPACAGNGRPRHDGRTPAADHPRVCGERISPARLSLVLDGSSPRVRGTAACGPDESGALRIIPACAGNGPPECKDSRLVADHPRVCGERTGWMISTLVESGSSPRVRGTVGEGNPAHTSNRIIPACAGNGNRWRTSGNPGADHPRVCGERGGQHLSHADRGGSSPRVRGTVEVNRIADEHRRIIPACAGNG